MKMCPRAMLSTEEVYETADEKREKREWENKKVVIKYITL
jgi:hypothetical protein